MKKLDEELKCAQCLREIYDGFVMVHRSDIPMYPAWPGDLAEIIFKYGIGVFKSISTGNPIPIYAQTLIDGEPRCAMHVRLNP